MTSASSTKSSDSDTIQEDSQMKFHWIAVQKPSTKNYSAEAAFSSTVDAYKGSSSQQQATNIVQKDAQMGFHWIAVGKRS
jgi:hypothetical protein